MTRNGYMKGTYQRPAANNKHDIERLDAFPIRPTIKGSPPSPLLFNIPLEVLGNTIRQQK